MRVPVTGGVGRHGYAGAELGRRAGWGRPGQADTTKGTPTMTTATEAGPRRHPGTGGDSDAIDRDRFEAEARAFLECPRRQSDRRRPSSGARARST